MIIDQGSPDTPEIPEAERRNWDEEPDGAPEPEHDCIVCCKRGPHHWKKIVPDADIRFRYICADCIATMAEIAPMKVAPEPAAPEMPRMTAEEIREMVIYHERRADSHRNSLRDNSREAVADLRVRLDVIEEHDRRGVMWEAALAALNAQNGETK